MTNSESDKTAPWANWTTTSRTPGILYVVAGLIVLSSSAAGAAAPPAAIDATSAVVADGPHQGPADSLTADAAQEAASDAIDQAAEATEGTERDETAEAASDATGSATSFKTGQKLSPEQIAAYKAYLSSIRDQGTHKGPGVVTAWS